MINSQDLFARGYITRKTWKTRYSPNSQNSVLLYDFFQVIYPLFIKDNDDPLKTKQLGFSLCNTPFNLSGADFSEEMVSVRLWEILGIEIILFLINFQVLIVITMVTLRVMDRQEMMGKEQQVRRLYPLTLPHAECRGIDDSKFDSVC